MVMTDTQLGKLLPEYSDLWEHSDGQPQVRGPFQLLAGGCIILDEAHHALEGKWHATRAPYKRIVSTWHACLQKARGMSGQQQQQAVLE